MDSRNTTTSSTIRTDYGSTTFKISIDDDGSTSLDIADTSTTTTTVGYQSLPSTFSPSLYAKSSLTSRFSRMTVDSMQENGGGGSRLCLQRIEYIFNVLNQICIGFVTIYMSWMCLRTGLAGTALHAWLATIGFCFLMAEGIMCHYGNNVLTFNYRRTTKTHIHWILQVLGGGCGIAGALLKLLPAGFKLWTLHGRLGFAAFILCCISLASGLASLFSIKIKKLISPLLNKTFHNILGIGTFAVALAAQYYGYNSGFFSRKTPSQDFTILIKVITLMILCLSCWGPLKALYHKLCNIVRHYS